MLNIRLYYALDVIVESYRHDIELKFTRLQLDTIDLLDELIFKVRTTYLILTHFNDDYLFSFLAPINSAFGPCLQSYKALMIII